jgi:hypothetical protein
VDGGLAILSCPGAGSSAEILAEVDMDDMTSSYCLPSAQLLLLARASDPCLLLKQSAAMEEISPSDVADSKLAAALSSSILLDAFEARLSTSVVHAFFVLLPPEGGSALLLAGAWQKGVLSFAGEFPLTGTLAASSFAFTASSVGAAFRFADGAVTSVVCTTKGAKGEIAFASNKVGGGGCTAVNVFVQNADLFSSSSSSSSSSAATTTSTAAPANTDLQQATEDKLYATENDGNEAFTSPLYETFAADKSVAAYNLSSVGVTDVTPASAQLFVAVVGEGGALSIFPMGGSSPVWACSSNLGYAPQMLRDGTGAEATPTSRNNTVVTVEELSFFVAGSIAGPQGLRSFYVLVRTSTGDLLMYAARKLFSDEAKCRYVRVVRRMSG